MKFSEYILFLISQRKKEEVSENPQTILLNLVPRIWKEYNPDNLQPLDHKNQKTPPKIFLVLAFGSDRDAFHGIHIDSTAKFTEKKMG